jgi:hypothetical protein
MITVDGDEDTTLDAELHVVLSHVLAQSLFRESLDGMFQEEQYWNKMQLINSRTIDEKSQKRRLNRIHNISG